jgi:cytoplasmic iron level regulating protein YaaA (DUF328/UPF0246 family)
MGWLCLQGVQVMHYYKTNSSDTLQEAFNVNAIIDLINQKFIENLSDKERREVVGEILNDIKLLLSKSASGQAH